MSWLSRTLLILRKSGVQGMKVEQNPSALSLQEGTSSTLRCSFSASMKNVQWFRRNPVGRLINLFFIALGTKQNGRLNSTLNSKDLYSTLHITASRLEDSATYLCAVEWSPAGSFCTILSPSGSGSDNALLLFTGLSWPIFSQVGGQILLPSLS
uniref:Ig-like domain-containing protein n=1 Tax=Equus asinus TaxID=9793 RepID=A0A9L0JT69_EQUAS